MDQSLISVIIPVYNMELYLQRCLDSVLNNTYRNLEIICIDDGSKDRSLEILQRYAAADPRVVVIGKENGGVSSARNAGLDRMSGEYVTFIDPDDYVHPQFFEILLGTIDLSGADIGIVGFAKTYENDLPAAFSHYSLTADDLILFSYPQIGSTEQAVSYIWCKLIPGNMIGATRFLEDVSYAEDTLFLGSLYEKNPHLHLCRVEFPLYFYYQGRQDSLVKIGKRKGDLRFITIMAERASNPAHESLYLEPSIRRGRYFRYYYTYIVKETPIARSIGKLLRRKIKQIIRCKTLPLKYRVTWPVFILFPGIERLFQLWKDPKLKERERFERAALEQALSD